MPYCCQCGQNVGPTDIFCASCGTQQPGQQAPRVQATAQNTDYTYGISPRTASLLCYIPIVGWVVAIVVLASQRFRNDHRVRFNAFQGLYLFVAWLIVDWVLSPLMRTQGDFGISRIFPGLLQVAVLCAWIFMIIKTAHDEVYKLPILGELAEKSVSEQR
jgi:uncharacterized membrane protein